MLCFQLTESLQKVAPHADDFDIALQPDKNGRIPEVKGMPTIDTDINKPQTDILGHVLNLVQTDSEEWSPAGQEGMSDAIAKVRDDAQAKEVSKAVEGVCGGARQRHSVVHDSTHVTGRGGGGWWHHSSVTVAQRHSRSYADRVALCVGCHCDVLRRPVPVSYTHLTLPTKA